MRLLLALLLVGTLGSQHAEARKFRMPKQTRQLLVVVSESWAATSAKLQRWERGLQGPWKKVGDPVDVALGRAGLAWGFGLHPDEFSMDRIGPLKQEGDGRSPAGVFRLGETTGYAPAAPAGSKLPYRQASPRLRCVDDRRSPSYNQLVEEPVSGPSPWASSEAMKRGDDVYKLTLFVEHNRKPIVPGQGSCIFLHVTSGGPTVGCTAMPLAELEAVVTWLDPAAQPLLVQLPAREHDQLASEWKLPRP
jgi:hypothetical protein